MKRLITKRDNTLETVMFPIYERRGKITLSAGLLVGVLLIVPSFTVDWLPTVYFFPALFIILGAIQWRREHKNRSKIELGEEGGFLVSGKGRVRIKALYVWPHVFVERSRMTSSPVSYSYMHYGIAAVVKKRNNSLQSVFEKIAQEESRPYTRGKMVEENIQSIARSTKPLLFHMNLKRVYNSVKDLAYELKVPVIFAQEEIKVRSLGRTPEVRVPEELEMTLRELFKKSTREDFPVEESDYPPQKEIEGGTLRYSWRKTKQIIGLIFGGILGLILLGIGLAFLFASAYPHTSIIFGVLAVALFLLGVFLSREHGRHVLEVGPEEIRYTRQFPWIRKDTMSVEEVKLIFYNDFRELLFVGENKTIHCKLQAMNPYIMYQEIRRFITGYDLE